jgi:BA14K-like protein
MKSRIAIAVSALTLGTALAVVPSFAQTNGQPSGTAAQQQGSGGCIVFQQGCSNKPYPMNNSEQTGSSQSRTARSAPSGQSPRMAQGRESETYRLGEQNRYNDYAPGMQVGAAGRGDTERCAMRFRSYDPATGTYMGFDGVPHACP